MSRDKAERYFLLISLGFLILLLAVSDIRFLLVALALELILLVAWKQIEANAKRYLVILFFIILGTAPLLFVRTQDAVLSLGGTWGITHASLELAALVTLRSLSSCLLVSIILYKVPIYRLCQILRDWHVPSLLVDLIELSYRYIHLLLERSEHIKDAQLLRLGYNGWSQKYEHGSMLLSRSFILAHSEAEQMYEGLLTRHFDESSEQAKTQDLKQDTEDKSLLSLEQIGFSYSGSKQPTLQDLNLNIQRGERIVLLGANGSGKSTLMKLLSGLHREQSGVFYLDNQVLGRRPSDVRQQRERIALIMQNANHQLFCPSVEAEIAFGLRNSGLQEAEVLARVEEIIEEYKLQDLRHKPPHLLSEGQKKWVSIAAIMALRPDVILMDEPTACLDCYYTDQVMKLASSYCDHGSTVILSTHDMNLAYAWADRAIVMSSGHKIFDGNMDELYQDTALLEEAKLHQPYGFEGIKEKKTEPRPKQDQEFRLGLFLHAPSLSALILGGGRGAVRKAQTLLQAGVSCTLIAPEEPSAMKHYLEDGLLSWEQGLFRWADADRLKAYDLIVAATSDDTLNMQVCRQALNYGKLVCNLSDPASGNIQFAALLDKQGIQIAVHTAYRVPEVSQAIRDKIAKSLEMIKEEELAYLQQLRSNPDRLEYTEMKNKFIEQLYHDWSNRN